MPDISRLALIAGPYVAPPARRGAWLDCEIAGRVQVGGIHDGPIPWPYRLRTGRHQLVLCGDLVQAVRVESELAIAHWWAVCIVTVWKWRQALGVERTTDGTARLYREYAPSKLTDEASARGRVAAATTEARARMIKTKTGMSFPPRSLGHRDALSAAATLRWARWRTERGE